jgi:AraC-like DNA-binding protein
MVENKRKLMTDGGLASCGIPLLAMYSNLSSESILLEHDHGPYFEICYLKRGTQKYCVENEEYILHGGDVFITFPNENHSSGNDPQSRGCLYWIHIDSKCENLLGLDKKSTDAVINSLYSIKKRKFRIRDDISSKLISACNLAEKKGPLDLIAAKALITVFLYDLINAESAPEYRNRISNPIAAAKEYIDNNVKEQLSLSNIADIVGFSLSHFKYKFTREIGMTPGEYIMQKKIFDSVSLLPERSLTYIAYEYSFSSPQHYSKNFKAVMGMTPKEYRKKMKDHTT